VPSRDAIGANAQQRQRLEGGQVVRHRRLLQIEEFGKFLHAALPLGQQADDAQTALVGHGLEESEQGGDVGVRHDRIHRWKSI